MASQACTENARKFYTVVKCECLKNNQLDIHLPATMVKLAQEISEEIEFSADITSLNRAGGYKCDCVFKFNDNEGLRSIYNYEIVCKALVEGSILKKHVYLFTEVKNRSEKELRFRRIFNYDCASVSEVFHVCFHIHRIVDDKSIEDYKIAQSVLSLLMEHGFDHDVELVVGDRRFQAHKHVLSSRSREFERTFQRDTLGNAITVINIEDFSEEVIDEVLTFIYSGNLKNLSAMVQEIYKAAHKFQIDDLKDMCEEYMILNMNLDNFTTVCDLAISYNSFKLQMKITSYFEQYEEELVQRQDCQEHLCQHLSNMNIVDTLRMCIQYNLENLKWAAFQYVKEHKDIVQNQEFLALFHSKPGLMKEMFIYVHGKFD